VTVNQNPNQVTPVVYCRVDLNCLNLVVFVNVYLPRGTHWCLYSKTVTTMARYFYFVKHFTHL